MQIHFQVYLEKWSLKSSSRRSLRNRLTGKTAEKSSTKTYKW